MFLQSKDRMRGFGYLRDFGHPMGQPLDTLDWDNP